MTQTNKEVLTLEMLAPYLPYEPKIKPRYRTMGSMGGFMRKHLTIDVLNENEIEDIVLFLRPLSELTEDIEHNGEKFVPCEKLNIPYGLAFMLNSENVLNLPHRSVKKLYEWHFAIDIPEHLYVNLNELPA